MHAIVFMLASSHVSSLFPSPIIVLLSVLSFGSASPIDHFSIIIIAIPEIYHAYVKFVPKLQRKSWYQIYTPPRID